MKHLEHRTSQRRRLASPAEGYYGSSSAAIDTERGLLYERLAACHPGTDVGARYLARAWDCWDRVRRFEKGERIDVQAALEDAYQD